MFLWTDFMTKNMKNLMTDILVYFLDWVVLVILWIRDSIRESPSIKIYHGGEGILPGYNVLKVQPEMMRRIGDKKAMIIQKFHDWIQYNERNNTHQYAGFTWTYGSYKDWHEKEFPFFSQRHLENLIRELEDDGFVISTTDMPKTYGRKAYRLNYERIFSYEPSKEGRDALEECSSDGSENFVEPSKLFRPYNIKTKSIKQAINQIKKPTTPNARAQTTTSTEEHVVVGDTKPDSGLNIGLKDLVQDHINNDGKDNGHDLPVVAVDEQKTPPSSATPPSWLKDKLQIAGFLPGDAHQLCEKFDIKAVERTVDYALSPKGDSLKNKAGYVVRALEKNLVPEGYTSSEDSYRDLAYTHGQWADFIES